jgi:oligopeptide/dipeptide ABC transporter ATP-binding protein
MIFVTHDLDLAAAVCDRITVMYAGCVVERQTTKELFAEPMHPYTQALIDSRPELERRLDRLSVVGGRPAAAWEVGDECVFASRCPHVADRCREGRPQMDRAHSGGQVACVRSESWRRDVVMGRGQDA